MTFLNPLALFGLFLGAIPVLIHLFSKTKKEYIEFSSLKFLKILEMRRIRRLKLKQILLLILRTLAVLFLILGFARPSVKGKLGTPLESQTKVSAVFVIDNSFSVKQPVRGRELFSILKELAVKSARQFSENDDMYLIYSASPDKVYGPAAGSGTFIKRIEREKTVSARAELTEALFKGIYLLSEKKSDACEIFIFSDFQKTGLEKITTAADSLRRNKNITLYCICPDFEDPANLTVTGIKPQNQLFAVNKDIKMNAFIANFSPKNVNDLKVNFYVENERTADAVLQLEPGQRSIREFSHLVNKPGFISGFIEVDDDRLELDNRQYFSQYIPDKRKVLVIQENRDPFLEINLLLNKNGVSGQECTFISKDRSSSVQFSDYDVVFYNNIRNFNANDGFRLKKYLDWGGKTVIVLSSVTGIGEYNDFIAKELSLPRAVIKRNHNTDGKSFLSFGRIDEIHPVWKDIISDPVKKYSSPHFFSTVLTRADKSSRRLINFSDGSPYIIEQASGNGIVTLINSGFSPAETDIQRKGVFIPLIQHLIKYLAVPEWNFKNDFTVNEELFYQFKGSAKEFEVIIPAGESIKILPKIFSNSYLLNHKGVTEPGIYKLFGDGRLIQQFAVNIDPLESDLKKFSEIELKDIFNDIPVRFIQTEEEVEAALLNLRYGTELASVSFLLVLILLLAEMIIEKESIGRKLLSVFRKKQNNTN